MKTDSLPEIFVSRQEAARTGSLLANCLLQKKLDLTAAGGSRLLSATPCA